MDIIGYMITHNTKISLVKNSLQFLIGASMLFAVGQSSDYVALLAPLIGFVAAYQSVYGLNDILDFSEDSKNKFKRALKPFARGEVSLETQVSKMFLYMLFGLSISFFASRFFGILVSIMLLLNFFHSYKSLNIKKTPIGLVNIFLIEFIKFSCGWFALGGSLQAFPYFIPAFMASAYALGYYSYKNDLNVESIKKKRSIISLAVILALYLFSVFFYKELRISLILMLPVFASMSLVVVNASIIKKMKIGSLLVIGLMAAAVILNFLLPYEPIHSINIWLANLF